MENWDITIWYWRFSLISPPVNCSIWFVLYFGWPCSSHLFFFSFKNILLPAHPPLTSPCYPFIILKGPILNDPDLQGCRWQYISHKARNIILSKSKLSSPAKYFSTSKTLKWCKNPPKKSCSKIKWMASFICFRTLVRSLLSQKTRGKGTLAYLSKNWRRIYHTSEYLICYFHKEPSQPLSFTKLH